MVKIFTVKIIDYLIEIYVVSCIIDGSDAKFILEESKEILSVQKPLRFVFKIASVW